MTYGLQSVFSGIKTPLNESDFELREYRWNEDVIIAVVIANFSREKNSGLHTHEWVIKPIKREHWSSVTIGICDWQAEHLNLVMYNRSVFKDACLCQPIIWSMAAILRDSFAPATVVPTSPWAIPLAIDSWVSFFFPFPFRPFFMSTGLRLEAPASGPWNSATSYQPVSQLCCIMKWNETHETFAEVSLLKQSNNNLF